MDIAATEAKSRADPVLDQEQPMVNADQFYGRYKDWVDEQNRRFDEHGSWNDEFRTW